MAPSTICATNDLKRSRNKHLFCKKSFSKTCTVKKGVVLACVSLRAVRWIIFETILYNVTKQDLNHSGQEWYDIYQLLLIYDKSSESTSPGFFEQISASFWPPYSNLRYLKLSFFIKPFSYMWLKNPGQKFKYLKNKNSYYGEIKRNFHHF